MAWLKRKPDPISERERALNQEIAALEAQIKKLGAEARPNDTRARQSSPVHDEQGINGLVEATPPRTRTPAEPIFEEVDLNVLTARNETPTTPEHYNELGVRKYDLPALFRRMRNNFRGPSTTNPKLVSYLAAGGIQGLRPLRYEKRVARNRFIFLVAFLFLMLLGLIAAFVKHH